MMLAFFAPVILFASPAPKETVETLPPPARFLLPAEYRHLPNNATCERTYNGLSAAENSVKQQARDLGYYGPAYQEDGSTWGEGWHGGGWHARQFRETLAEIARQKAIWWSAWWIVWPQATDAQRAEWRDTLIGLIGPANYALGRLP